MIELHGLSVQPSAIMYALPLPSTFSEVMVRPNFFLSGPDMAPRTVWSATSGNGDDLVDRDPTLGPEHRDQDCLLGAGCGDGRAPRGLGGVGVVRIASPIPRVL